MSRIEDALAKLQAAGPAPSRAPAAALPPVARRAHVYGGKPLRVDAAALQRSGLLAPGRQERRLADEYRSIKRPLLANASADRDPLIEHGNLLMVTSALPGEGKTFTCLNLCFGIAREKDWDVVLVDADVHKPHLTRVCGADKERGLLDLLRDPGASFDSLVMPSDVPGLAFLPVGTPDEHAAELLASARMASLCASLASPHRMIVFDSSPLLLTAESAALAGQVGQIVLVVRAHKTPQQSVLHARDKLDPAKAVSVLLNQGDASRHGTYGDVYYGQAQR